MKWLLVILCCMLCLLSLGFVYAENVKLDEIVVTATRTEVQRSEIPTSVTVITKEDIEERHVSTVTDLLRDVTGIDVVQQGGVGKTTSVFIRGAESRHTLVLIDGVRVNSPTTGGFDFADLSIDNIERVEIIRGPLSTIYGSDAIGGVIQIFTKKGRTSVGSASSETGSYGTTKEVVSTELKRDFYDISIAASRMDSEGFSAAKAGTERDGYQNTTVSSRIGISPRGTTYVDIIARLAEVRTELDFGSKWNGMWDDLDIDDPNYQQQRRWIVVGMDLSSALTSTWAHKLSLTSSNDMLVYFDEDASNIRDQINMEVRTLNWQHNIHTGEGSQFTLGYELQDQKGEKEGAFIKAFKNHAFYLQDHRGLGTPVQFLAGIRWDDSTIYESALTYRAGISYLQMEGVKWYAQYGTGFMGPTLNALFWPEDTFSVGNPDLKPEKSNGWEVGVEQALSEGLSISVSYYDNVFEDLIQWIPNPSGKWQPQNRAKAGSNGIGTNIAWHLSSIFQIEGNYIYDDTDDKESHFYLQRRPLNKYAVTLRLNPVGKGKLDVNFTHVGKRVEWADIDFDGKPDQQRSLAAYSKVDLMGSYKIGKATDLFGRIENLFDKEYEEARGYGVAGFSAYGGLRMTF